MILIAAILVETISCHHIILTNATQHNHIRTSTIRKTNDTTSKHLHHPFEQSAIIKSNRRDLISHSGRNLIGRLSLLCAFQLVNRAAKRGVSEQLRCPNCDKSLLAV